MKYLNANKNTVMIATHLQCLVETKIKGKGDEEGRQREEEEQGGLASS